MNRIQELLIEIRKAQRSGQWEKAKALDKELAKLQKG